MKNILLAGVIFIFLFACNQKKTLRYSVANQPWEQIMGRVHKKIRPDSMPTEFPSSIGNHRAVINIPSDGEVAHLNLEWRRHDKDVDRHRFIILNARANDTVQNIYRIDVNNERCNLLFGPVSAGKYYFYYLPYELQGGWGGYSRNYLPQEPPPDKHWLKKINIEKNLKSNYIEAKPVEIQARTEFDSFYPMEVIATEKEKEVLKSSLSGSKFLLFPEDRKYPIRMLDNIPQKWILNPMTDVFEGTAYKNEYYAFQVGLWAMEDIENVRVEFTSLKGSKYTLPVTSMTCFNTGGIDPFGKPFSKMVNVEKNKVQTLWIGVDIPQNIPPGKYSGKMTINTKNCGQKYIEVNIKVLDKILVDRGDGETWRYSRLRWLNSTAGIDDNPIPPYEFIKVPDEKVVVLSGKELSFSESGLPSSIKVWSKEILAAPIQFEIKTGKGNIQFNTNKIIETNKTASSLSKKIEQTNDLIKLTTHSEAWCDGYLKYTFDIEANKDINVTDIQLVIPVKKNMARYIIGMGLPGTDTPETHEGKWDILHDSFWLGNTNGGISCELRGAPYSGPLLMFYNTAPPPSWDNNGKGGFRIRTSENQRDAIVYSGPRTIKKGESIKFECAFVITPVKKLNTYSQFTDRYFHDPLAPEPSEKAVANGVKVINVHQANKYNPNINYPFIAVKELKDFVDRWHSKGMKVKIYYTVRELSNFTTEIWALRSLGDEILASGPGGGYPWLREHLVDDYIPQWYQYLGDLKGADAAIMTSPGNTRWYNYYVEGLKWLVKEMGIDGLYLDAAAYGREMIMRMRKVMNEVKPNCIIDLHAGTYGGPPVLQYTEFFPYLDKIWFGELYNYNEMSPANWLVEVSGIPFGLMGDMLPLAQAGGENPWRGMIYGMTSRLPYTDKGVSDPTEIWKAWDSFGIADAKMIGYWDEKPIVTTSNKDVLATAYLKNKKMLISIASWAKETTSVKLKIDFARAGINPDNIKITAPAIKNFQPEKAFARDESITIESKKGWLLVVEEE